MPSLTKGLFLPVFRDGFFYGKKKDLHVQAFSSPLVSL